MSDQRKPLVGWTYSAKPDGSDNAPYQVFDATGAHACWAFPDELGIPAPPPPRTGTLGLSEEDTRNMAGRSYDSVTLLTRACEAAAAMCRADVARWDAEDAAARNAVPDTLTVELPLRSVRYAADTRWYTSSGEGLGDACRAALDEAGLA